MSEDIEMSGTPLVLLVDDEEWTARSLQSILQPNGYAVLFAYTGREGLDLARKVNPDILMITHHLPDMSGEDLARKLQRSPSIRPSTPVVFFTSGSLDRERRAEMLRAGAWHVMEPPFDPDEILLRFRTFINAKQDVDMALGQTDVDAITGFYNVRGLMRRTSEIAADASRSQRPLACVVLGPSGVEGIDESALTESEELAEILMTTTRVSDAIARVGMSEFVIVAPGTDDAGASRLAERLLDAVDRSAEDLPESLRSLKAGIHAVTELDKERISPESLLHKATGALRDLQKSGNGTRTKRFVDRGDH